MKKLIRNKKGMNTMNLIVAIIVALLMLGVYLYFVNKTGEGGKRFVDISQGSFRDFDNDGLADSADPCPCGSPINEKNEKVTIDGIDKCVLAYNDCPTSYAFSNHGFIVQDIPSKTRKACVYTANQCNDFLKEYYKDKK